MINIIAALDEKNGIANEHGIPWDIKIDKEYFREKTKNSKILMGYRTYAEFSEPLPDRGNYVLSNSEEPLRPGFIKVNSLEEYTSLPESTDKTKQTWIIGGGGVFSQSIDKVNRLYLTRIAADYNCTVFFPDYEVKFRKIASEKQLYEATTLYFEVWERISL